MTPYTPCVSFLPAGPPKIYTPTPSLPPSLPPSLASQPILLRFTDASHSPILKTWINNTPSIRSARMSLGFANLGRMYLRLMWTIGSCGWLLLLLLLLLLPVG